jgi:hypothetical protein
MLDDRRLHTAVGRQGGILCCGTTEEHARIIHAQRCPGPGRLRACGRLSTLDGATRDGTTARDTAAVAFAIELSDEEWELVADLFDPPGRRGTGP